MQVLGILTKKHTLSGNLSGSRQQDYKAAGTESESRTAYYKRHHTSNVLPALAALVAPSPLAHPVYHQPVKVLADIGAPPREVDQQANRLSHMWPS